MAAHVYSCDCTAICYTARMKENTKQLIADFLRLQRNYQFTRRSSMTKERFKDVAQANPKIALDPSATHIVEPLIEHVGHLPIIASFFHQYLEHSNELHLGRVLIMLSIHDIGETELGDINTYTKTTTDEEEEIAVARKLIPPTLLPYFEEFEALETMDAKYAKVVDAMAPIFHKLDMPYINQKRFHAKGLRIDDIIKKKRTHMEWDSFLLEMFDVCIEQLKNAEENNELLFPAVSYDVK